MMINSKHKLHNYLGLDQLSISFLHSLLCSLTYFKTSLAICHRKHVRQQVGEKIDRIVVEEIVAYKVYNYGHKNKGARM